MNKNNFNSKIDFFLNSLSEEDLSVLDKDAFYRLTDGIYDMYCEIKELIWEDYLNNPEITLNISYYLGLTSPAVVETLDVLSLYKKIFNTFVTEEIHEIKMIKQSIKNLPVKVIENKYEFFQTSRKAIQTWIDDFESILSKDWSDKKRSYTNFVEMIFMIYVLNILLYYQLVSGRFYESSDQ